MIEADEHRQDVRRPRAVREPIVQPAARRHRRRHRSERRRQDDAVPDARRPDEARQRRRSAWATRVQLAYVDQSRDTLDDNKTVWEEISDGQDIMRVGTYETPSRGYVGRFNFRGTDQQKKVGLLSGGERNRVHLAKVLNSGGNLLLLDEPTNDLDVETLRALEEALLSFPGSAVVISHDRWFLDRIATHILAFEGDSEVVYFQGNYADYAEDSEAPQGRGRGPAAPDPLQAPRLSASRARAAPSPQVSRERRESVPGGLRAHIRPPWMAGVPRLQAHISARRARPGSPAGAGAARPLPFALAEECVRGSPTSLLS